MHAGVVKSKYRKSDLDKAISHYKEAALPEIAKHEGSRSAMLFVNRETGDGLSVAIYENEAAAKSFGPKAEKLIATFQSYLAPDAKPSREIYELATSTMLESKAVIERGYKAFNAHDLEALNRLAAPDIVVTAPGDQVFKGPVQAKEFDQNWITAFPDAHVEPKQIVAQGNLVVVQGVFTGTHNGTLKTPMGDIPATGRKAKGDYTEVFEVDRGLIKKQDVLFDRVQLMTQLGMSVAPQPQAQKAAR